MKAQLIVNPRAGTGRALLVSRVVASFLSQQGTEVQAAITVASDDAVRVAAMCDADVLIAIGGDGTLNAAARGVLARSGPSLPVGFVPAGSGNVARQAFALPGDPRHAAAVISRLRTRKIDVGVATRDGVLVGVFLLWLSAGLDAAFIRAFATARRNGESVGTRRLVRLLARTLREYAFPQLTVTTEHGFAASCVDAVVANVATAGLVGNIAPLAQPDDGLFDVVAIDRSAVRWGTVVWGLLSNDLPSCRGVLTTTTRRVSLRSESAVPLQLDGEEAGWLPIDIALHPRRLRLVVP